MRKIAVYSITPNCIEFTAASIKSLLINSSVDMIYLLLPNDENDTTDYSQIFPINVTIKKIDVNQYIEICCPNRFSMYTPMCLIRCAFHKIFDDEDVVLSLDYDTIVDDNIDALWDIQKLEKWKTSHLAGVKEIGRTSKIFPGVMLGSSFVQMGAEHYVRINYINAGVMLMNLKFLRESGYGDAILSEVNRTEYLFPEQDVFNKYCSQTTIYISPEYNANQFTDSTIHGKIIHFAGTDNKDTSQYLIEKYSKWTWESIVYHRQIKYSKYNNTGLVEITQE